MSLLDRKLVRDLSRMRGQVITMALVVAAGAAIFVASVSVYRSLLSAQEASYVQGRFPDLFATVKRAPLAVLRRIRDIDGVAAAEGRIARHVIVDWPGSDVPVSARIVSLPAEGGLGGVTLRRGLRPDGDRGDAVLISEGFAQANGVSPGDRIRVILNGRLRALRVSGIAVSPEYVFAAKPGVPIPDDRSFLVIWMPPRALMAATGFEGAFDDLAVLLAPGANERAVTARIDALLEPYGSGGATGRDEQPSQRFLTDELRQQRLTAETVPLVFLGVAAFLLNVALGRLVSAQREQIASLKALGFATAPIAAHYLKFIAVVVALGAGVGVAAGVGLGRLMMLSYAEYFRFASFPFRFAPWSAGAAVLVALAAAAAGAWSALWRVVRLPAAEAMRPVAPIAYRRFDLERYAPRAWRPPRRIMILRAVAGRPFRTLFTLLGVASAMPLVVLGLFWRDALGHMVDVQFNLVQRANAYVTFPNPVSQRAVDEIARMPGVLVAEGQRFVSVRLRSGPRTELGAVTGLAAGSTLNQPLDSAERPIVIPPDGLVMNRRLADKLGLSPGDEARLEFLEGERPVRLARVAALVEETIGQGVYADLAWLNRIVGEDGLVDAAALHVDPQSLDETASRFKAVPGSSRSRCVATRSSPSSTRSARSCSSPARSSPDSPASSPSASSTTRCVSRSRSAPGSSRACACSGSRARRSRRCCLARRRSSSPARCLWAPLCRRRPSASCSTPSRTTASPFRAASARAPWSSQRPSSSPRASRAPRSSAAASIGWTSSRP